MTFVAKALVGIVTLLIAFHSFTVFVSPFFDIVYFSLNVNRPDFPGLYFYVSRSFSIYTNYYAILLVLYGVVLGYTRFSKHHLQSHFWIYFTLPLVFSALILFFITIQGSSQEFFTNFAKGIIRSSEFLFPFLVAWLIAPLIGKIYSKFTGEVIE